MSKKFRKLNIYLKLVWRKIRRATKKTTVVVLDQLKQVKDVYKEHSDLFNFVWHKILPPATSFMLVFAVLTCLVPISFAYEVKVDGKTVGYVTDRAVYNNACQKVNEQLVADTFNGDVVFTEKVVGNGDIDNVSSICDNIISDAAYTYACGLYIDGELKLICPERTAIENAVSAAISTYYPGADASTVSCSNYLDYKEGLYAPDEKFCESPSFQVLAKMLDVCIVTTEVKQEYIPFATEKRADASKYIGYEIVYRGGAYGTKNVTYSVYYKNGEVVKSEAISEVVTKQPEPRIEIYGTKALKGEGKGTDGGNAYFFWPVARVENSFITAYWGDGRNHRAVDICAPAGTAIYAGADGVVTEVAQTGDYGKYFIIDHGNGFSTLYSHCSSMFVSVGQRVERGEHVAAIGMTGRATGNHLHFEVRINGVRVNPNTYLGLN